MSRYTEMSTEMLYKVIEDSNKAIEINEQYGSKIALLNAMHCRDCAIEVIESRELPLADQQVEDFMENQANARDREYELEHLSKWSDN